MPDPSTFPSPYGDSTRPSSATPPYTNDIATIYHINITHSHPSQYLGHLPNTLVLNLFPFSSSLHTYFDLRAFTHSTNAHRIFSIFTLYTLF